MKTPTEMIRILNKHLIPGEGKELQTFSLALNKELTDEEFKSVHTMIEKGLIDNYRGKFYTLEHKKQKVKGTVSMVSIMRDENEAIHTIMCDGAVLYTKEL